MIRMGIAALSDASRASVADDHQQTLSGFLVDWP
jgi:hypothetical protein